MFHSALQHAFLHKPPFSYTKLYIHCHTHEYINMTHFYQGYNCTGTQTLTQLQFFGELHVATKAECKVIQDSRVYYHFHLTKNHNILNIICNKHISQQDAAYTMHTHLSQ